MKKYINSNSILVVTILIALISYAFLRSTEYRQYIDTIIVSITIIGSLPIAYNLIISIYKKQFGVDLIALFAIIATLLTNEHLAGAIILLMLSTGVFLEKYAEGQAKNALENLLRYAPTKAHRVIKGTTNFEDITVQEIKIGDTLLIKRGEIMPVDGVVVSGVSSIDESIVTGEPMPRSVKPSSKVWSGTTNTVDVIYIKSTTNYEQSTFSAIIRLVERAQDEKAPTVRLANKFSVVFTVTTFIMAGIAWYIDPKLVAAVLVVATPCPLILAAPIAFIAGMSRSAKNGIIVKHGGVFELITKAHSFFFDKTGTLTFGVPQVNKIIILDNSSDKGISAKKWTKEEVLALSASVEQFSTHILSQSIVALANTQKLDLFVPEKFEETLGQGISGIVKTNSHEATVVDGRASLLESKGITISGEAKRLVAEAKATGEMAIYIAVNNRNVAVMTFSDKIRSDIADILEKIKETGAEIVLVTGDTEDRAQKIGEELGFTIIEANCLPEHKMDLIQKYEAAGKPVVMIGDGVNDAPAIGRASVGIALGYHGATASTDTADAIITSDDTAKVLKLIQISHKTMTIAMQSIFIGMALSLTAMVFAIFGFITPISGALLQEAIDVLVILNALRALRN
ncbi:MAG: heavy metal translocating P-type ATPase [bacterium]